MAYPSLRHRIFINFEGMSEGKTQDELISKIIEEIEGKMSVLLINFKKLQNLVITTKLQSTAERQGNRKSRSKEVL